MVEEEGKGGRKCDLGKRDHGRGGGDQATLTECFQPKDGSFGSTIFLSIEETCPNQLVMRKG